MKHILYATGYKYQLRIAYVGEMPELADTTGRAPIRTRWIELEPNGVMSIAAGYAWDGASGPTIDTSDTMRASLGHDAGYQLLRLGLLQQSARPTIDLIFRRVCKEDGMWGPRAELWYHAVRLFGKPFADPAKQEPDIWAPRDPDAHVK